MRIHPATLAAAAILAATSIICIAQPMPTPPVMREAALENLLAERGDTKQLETAIAAARNVGVSEQAILEARFLYHVDLLDDAAIAAMLPEFIRQQQHFRLEDSAIFAVREDWLAVVEYVKAIAALQNNDKEGFKQHIKEAFWLGPRQASAFAPHIERLRHEEAMNAITIDFNTSVTPLENQQARSLASLIDGHKALVLHFWSPQSRECEASLPDFDQTSRALAQHGITTLSICPESSAQAIEMSRPYQASCALWAADSAHQPLGSLLRVQDLPTMTVINPAGKILYSGDPAEDRFWQALRSISPEIERPKSDAAIDR